MESQSREVVVFLVDANPVEWAHVNPQQDITFPEFLDQLFAYLSQMILCDVFQLAPVVAYNQFGARWLFPAPERVDSLISGRLQATNTDEVLDYCRRLLDGLRRFAAECARVPSPRDTGVRLDVALSFALSHLNKYPADANKRIMVLTRSPDPVANFESTMNAVFAAHRIRVVIDSILIKVRSSLFLNQAAILTNGFSIALQTRPKCLIQYLLTIPPLCIRHLIVLKKVKAIDYKTPAVNTKNMIDIGLMCPVCLSVFEKTEKPMFRCTVCGTRQQILD
jgi:transcription initiation factor TFIIH subunit 3